MRHYLDLLFGVIGPQYRALARVFALFVVLSLTEALGIGLVVPLIASIDIGQSSAALDPNSLFGQLDALLKSVGLDSSTKLLIVLVLIFYAKSVLGYMTQRAIFNFGYANQKRLIDGLVKKYQVMSLQEFTDKETANLIQNLIGNVEIVCQGAIVASIRLLSELTVILCIALVLLLAQPWLTILMVALIGFVVFAYDRLFRQRIRYTGELAAEARATVIKNFQAVMQGFKEIHVIGRLEFFNRLIYEGTTGVKKSAVDYKVMNAMPRYLMESTAITGIAIIFFFGGRLGVAQADLIAAIGTFAVAALRLIPGANQIASAVIQMRNSYYGLQKVCEGLQGDDAIEEEPEGAPAEKDAAIEVRSALSRKPITITLENVSFAYRSSGEPVLEGLDIKLESGRVYGFTGSSGSGKTTALDLILGFHTPTRGRVLIDAKPRDETADADLSAFCYVPQEPFLFTGSVRENITLGREMPEGSVSLDHAVKLACLDDFLAELPEGIDSMLGERAVNISGGQRQRIALARAFYLDRPVLVLDEPTSALDAATARQVMANIISLRGNKTIIVTSHDPAIIERCDRTFDFLSGKARDLQPTEIA